MHACYIAIFCVVHVIEDLNIKCYNETDKADTTISDIKATY